MSKCVVLDKMRQIGNNRSHANNATKREFNSNIQSKRYTLSNGKTVKINVSAKGIRMIDKKGIGYLEAILAGEK